jgi:DNA modification methylase
MSVDLQRSLISDLAPLKKAEVSGSFINNMRLPIHRWFRYSAGFSAHWVSRLLIESKLTEDSLLFDPFAGSATTLLAADSSMVSSIGLEAHSFIARIAQAKLMWPLQLSEFCCHAARVRERALTTQPSAENYPDLLTKCFSSPTLETLNRLRTAWTLEDDNSPPSKLVWLAITAILRRTSSAGTAQWQYILPNKTKKLVADPLEAYSAQIELMREDMLSYQKQSERSLARLVKGDARKCPEIKDHSVDLIVTSPPYANNYDYADATRLEMCFWGEVRDWSDLHQAIRKDLIVSSSQHASLDKLQLDHILPNPLLKPIHSELVNTCRELQAERLLHGGKKHYHTMLAGYFLAMAEVWRELHRVCKPNAKACFIIGDSAPYGIHVPVERWLGDLAIASGFKSYTFQKLRDRNIKWENRKHRVPLHEGLLWVNN